MSTSTERSGYLSHEDFYRSLSSLDPTVASPVVKIFAQALEELPDPYAEFNSDSLIGTVILSHYQLFSARLVAIAYKGATLKKYVIPPSFQPSSATIALIEKIDALVNTQCWSIEPHQILAKTAGSITFRSLIDPSPGAIALMCLIDPFKLVRFNPDNAHIVLKAVKANGIALKEASLILRQNPDIVKAAARQNWESLQYAASICRDRSDIIKIGIWQNGLALMRAGPSCQDNPVLVLEAIMSNAYAFEFASARCQDIFHIVLWAVNMTGMNLRYAGPTCRNSPMIVMTAFIQNYQSLLYASDELKKSKAFALELMHANPRAFDYLDISLQADPDIIALRR